MINDAVLHDALYDNLESVVRNSVDNVLARLAHNVGSLPSNEHTAAMIVRVLEGLSGLPGTHWLPDDMMED